MTLPRRSLLPALAAPFLIGAPSVRAANVAPVVVGGTGGALAALRTVAIWFTEETGIPVTVLPSLGTEGGLRATADGKLHVGVIGRVLTEADLARGVSGPQVWRVPLGFVTSFEQPRAIAIGDLAGFIGDPASVWPGGTKLRPILRPPSESDYPILVRHVPGMEAALARLRRRPELPVATNDQDALDLAEQMEGSIVSTTLAQIISEGRNLRFVPLNGIMPSVDALASGAYPLAKPLQLIRSQRTPPQGDRFIDYLRSAEGQTRLSRIGCLV